MKKKIFLSQCMIVKNEEANIERALSWAKEIADEQIVVDTGSTDRTVEIAERCGARVCRFVWQDDFAAAKNFAIDQTGGRWVLLLDADEYMSREDAVKLRSYLERLDGGPYGQILARWLHLDDEGRVLASGVQVRAFVRAPYLRYRRRIHEYLFSSDPEKGKLADASGELTIFHTGYGKRESSRKTAERRNLRLIEMELEDHPDDGDMMGYLGDEYYSLGEFEKAKEAFFNSIKKAEGQPKDRDIRTALTFTKLLEILVKENAPEEELLSVSGRAKAAMPKEADFDYQMGSYYMNQGEWKKARGRLEEALSIVGAYGSAGRSMMIGGQMVQAYEMLALSCYKMGDLAKCVHYSASLLKESPYRFQILCMMLSAFLTGRKKSEEADQALGLLGQIYHLDALKDRLFLLRAVCQTGDRLLEEKLRALFSPEELRQVDQALGQRRP